MKKVNPFVSLLFLSFSLSAQTTVIPLWPEGIPCSNELEMEVKVDEEIGRRISKVHEPEVEIYLLPKGEANGASVVICPGGGYTILAWDWEGTLMAEWFNSFGVTAFVLKYRLPHWESEECRDQVALMDVQRAIRLVRSRAEEWKLDSKRIGIMGFSAGGHLASTASTHFDNGNPKSENPVEQFSCRPDFSILMYPVVTMDPEYAHMGSRTNLIGEQPSLEQVRWFSNELQVGPETPPAILIHANDDDAVLPENSINYYLALRKHQIPAALHVFEGGGHGFSFAKKQGTTSKWPELCKGWLEDRGLLSTSEEEDDKK